MSCMPTLRKSAFLFFLSILLASGCSRGAETTTGPVTNPTPKVQQAALMVFSGAANKPPLTELAKAFEKKANCRVDVTFAGSGTVLTQFVQEKVGDVYVPGSDDFMEKAKKMGAIDPASERLVAWLLPVINVVKGNPKGIKRVEDLAKPGLRIAIADAEAVCLGEVAEKIFSKLHIAEAVRNNIVDYPLSCEGVANRVETGEVDAVIGWDVFAHWAPEKIENVPIPKELTYRRYISAAVTTYSKHKQPAQQFVDFLAGEEANALYSKHGYTVPQPGEALPATLGH